MTKAAAFVFLGLLIAMLPAAASARPSATKGVLVYASVRDVGVSEPGDPDGFPDLFAVRLDGTGFRRLTRTTWGEQDPAWSPDRQLIAYSRGETYCHASSCEWGPISASIWVATAYGQRRRALTRADEAQENSWLEGSPAWSPDGKKVAFARNDNIDGADPTNGIYVVGADGRGLARLSRAHAISLAWSPSGSTIAYVHESGRYVGLLDVTTRRARRLRASGIFGPLSVDWSPRGEFLAVGTGAAVFIVPAAGGAARRIVEAPGANEVSWSPDGCCLAFSAVPKGARFGRPDLYVVSVRGGRPRRLTRNRGSDFTPAWRP